MPTIISTQDAAERYKPNGKLEYLSVSHSKNLKLRVTKAGSKDWVLRYSVRQETGNRKFKYHVLGPCDREMPLKVAREKAIIELARLEQEKKEASSKQRQQKAQGHTLSSLWELYAQQDSYLTNAKKTQKEKKNSWQNFSTFISQEKAANEVTINDVADYMHAKASGLLSKSRKKSSKIGANRDIDYMRTIFNWAKRRRFINENPCIGLDKYSSNTGWESIPLELYDDVVSVLRKWHLEFDHDKRDWVRNECGSMKCDEYRRQTANFVLFLLFTGMRKNEAQSLQYMKDNNKNNYLSYISSEKYNDETGKFESVNRFVVTLRQHKTVKSIGPRTIALTDAAAELIQIRPPFSIGRLGNKSKWVFHNNKDNGPISDIAITKIFKSMNEIFKDFIDFKITPRSTRHTFARHSLSLGLSHDKLADILGHQDTSMIRRHYAKTDERQVNAAVDDLNRRNNLRHKC